MSNEMTDNLLEGARREHMRLYAKLLEDPSKEEVSFESEQERQKFIADANDFLQDLKVIAPKVRSLSDYTWLINTSLQWQVAFLTLLNTQKRVEIPTLPHGLMADNVDLSGRIDKIARTVWYFRFMDEIKSQSVFSDKKRRRIGFMRKFTLRVKF